MKTQALRVLPVGDKEVEKRREKARVSQKAYRAHQKRRVEVAGERVIELKRAK